VFAYVAMPFILVWFRVGREFVLSAGAALILSWGVCVQLIAFCFPKKRPYQEFGFIPLAGKGLFSRIDTRYDAFPSGHTTALITLTLVAWLFSPPLALLSLVLAFITATCRVLLGYHYISDILGGVMIAGVVVFALNSTGIFAALEAFAR
jgi:undecaprenyl-diphosphatase